MRYGKYFGSELRETKLRNNGEKFVLCTSSVILCKVMKFGRVRWVGGLARLRNLDIRREF